MPEVGKLHLLFLFFCLFTPFRARTIRVVDRVGKLTDRLTPRCSSVLGRRLECGIQDIRNDGHAIPCLVVLPPLHPFNGSAVLHNAVLS